MIPLKINQISYFLKENISILEACRFVGETVPRFCYHETLSIAGNCRMCLVRLDTDDKLLVSCVNDISSGIEVFTEDASIKKAREDIMEFLLLDHPLDCPICDQGGECDLQDQAKTYGTNHNRFLLNKVSVEDKKFNSFVKGIMTRCIHCTRCVRFSSEIVGSSFFGTLNRGNSTEIGSYILGSYFDSEISGNVIDLCPVGALTSKPYAFKARPWELKTVESIDITDSLGSNIYLNFSESEVLRVLPKYNLEINENIISDKARFSYDSSFGLDTIKGSKNVNQIQLKSSFYDLIKQLSSLKKLKTTLLVNEEIPNEFIQYLINITRSNSNLSIRIFSKVVNKSNFYINSNYKIQDFYSSNKNCFLFAINPRTEAALLNKRLRYLNFHNYFNIYNFGHKYVSNYKMFFSNFNLELLFSIIEGKSAYFSTLLAKFDSPLVLFGTSLYQRNVSSNVLQSIINLINPSTIFITVPLKSNSVGSDFFNLQGITTNDILKSESFLLYNPEENITFRRSILSSKGKHFFCVGSSLLQNTNENFYFLPSSFFGFFTNGTFINLEGRPQKSSGINAVSDLEYSYFTIFNNLFNSDKSLKFNSLYNSFFDEIIFLPSKFLKSSKKSYSNLLYLKNLKHFYFNNYNKMSFYPLKAQIVDFYRTNNFTRLSKNMCIASKELESNSNNFFN